MDPITYLLDAGTLVGTFIHPGQVATNPGGPYKAAGVLHINSDWIEALGLHWTLTINTPKPKVFFPAHFNASGKVLSAWVSFDSSVTDWGSYTVAAVRNSQAVALTNATSGVGGSLEIGEIDLTIPQFSFIPMALQYGNPPKIQESISKWWHYLIYFATLAIAAYGIYRLYKFVRGIGS